MSKLFILTILLTRIISAIFAQGPLPSKGNVSPFLQCETFCRTNHLDFIDCDIPALFERGLCYECGPFKQNPSLQLCNRQCTDTATDPNNCGDCAIQCTDGQTCQSGACECPTGQPLCGTGDTAMCCESDQTCINGECSTFQTCPNTGCGGGICPSSANCFCIGTPEGNNVCVDNLIDCSGVDTCTASSDCPPGYVCGINVCCPRSRCVNAASCAV